MDATADSTGFERLDDIIAFERTPLVERMLPESTYEALRRGAAIAPDAPALTFFKDVSGIDDPRVLTHRALLEGVHRTANALRRLGLGRQDVVACLLPNQPETHFVLWGGSAAGRVLAINPMLEAEQIGALIAAVGARLIVAPAPIDAPEAWAKAIKAARLQDGPVHVLVCGSTPSVAPFDQEAAGAVATLRERSSVRISDFRSELGEHAADRLTFEPPKPRHVSTLLCTGGTTGLPKIAKRTHAAEVYTCWATAQFNPDLYAPGRTSFCGLPLFHANAIMVTGLLPLMHGGHVVLGGLEGYRSEGVLANFWKIVERFDVAVFSGVPTIYDALLQVPLDGADIGSLICGVCGAAPMPAALFETFEAKTGVRIVEGYGLTEGTVASSRNPLRTDRSRIGSIGLRLPYQRMRAAVATADGEFERWSELDEVGEIFISGPNLFEGYADDEQDAGVWAEVDGRRWFKTGDLARQDVDGYFWMTGRRKELIIRGGHNIDPKMIEEAVHAHPDVALAAAVGRPDARVGEVPVVYYQGRAGADPTFDDLAAFARARGLERAAVPKDFIRLDGLPLTSVGKIDKLALEMRELEATVRSEAAACAAALRSVCVRKDARRGLVTEVAVLSGQARLEANLGRYAFAIDYVAANAVSLPQES